MVYLSDQRSTDKGDEEGDQNKDSNICDICAIVFLKLPYYLLSSCNKKTISSIIVDKIKFDESDVNVHHANVDPLGWTDICKLLHINILKSTASLFVGIGSKTLMNGDYMTSLINAISLLHPSNANDDDNVSSDDMNASFSQYIQSVRMRVSQKKSDLNKDHSENGSSNDNSDNDIYTNNNNDDDYDVSLRLIQDIWIHLVFLARDLLVHFPELLPKTLPQLCEILLRKNRTEEVSVFLKADSTRGFPTPSECLLVLVLSSTCASLSEPTSSPTLSSSNTEEIKIAMIKKQVRTKRTAVARSCLKKLLDPIFSNLTDICERMLKYSPDKGVEAAAVLCDITQLFIIDDTAPSSSLSPVNRSHEKLITSRVLSMLVKIWMDILSDVKSNRGGNNMIATVCRITKLLSIACLQSTDTSAFLIRFPNFIPTVTSVKDSWDNQNGDVVIKPGCLLSLLIGIMTAVDALNIGNDAINQLDLELRFTLKCILDEYSKIDSILSSKNANDASTGRLIRSENALSLIDSLSICIEMQNIKLLNKAHKEMLKVWVIDIVSIINTIISKIIAIRSIQNDKEIRNPAIVDRSLDSVDDNLNYYDTIKRLCKGLRSLFEEQETTKTD